MRPNHENPPAALSGQQATVGGDAPGTGHLREAGRGYPARHARRWRELHADCEALLLADGSQQEDVWGADWVPSTQQVTYEALINLRPRQDNLSMEILDPSIRQRVVEIVRRILEGV
jgi:hypothetical protein